MPDRDHDEGSPEPPNPTVTPADGSVDEFGWRMVDGILVGLPLAAWVPKEYEDDADA